MIITNLAQQIIIQLWKNKNTKTKNKNKNKKQKQKQKHKNKKQKQKQNIIVKKTQGNYLLKC